MRIYIQSIDYKLWRITLNDPRLPTKRVERVDVPKPEAEWDEKDVRMLQSNAKAMNILYCALDPNEFNRISSCESAKEV